MIVGDILNPKELLGALEGIHYVYHVAGIAITSQAASHPKKQ
jgi:hypothetical protein